MQMIDEKQPVRREFSAGGCVYKRDGDRVVWLIGKHSGYHKWVLPKGLIELGERGVETALREVWEEMGVKARLVEEKPIHALKYVYWANFGTSSTSRTGAPERRVIQYQEAGGVKTKVFKQVSFYLMEYESGDPAHHDWEMEEAGWYPFEEATKLLAFEGEREALRKAQSKLLEIDR